MLAGDRVDAVVIATPASTHRELVQASLESGHHVLVEKPMALDVAGCDALCDLAAASGRVLMVGYTFLYNAGVRKMKECMAPDQFGQVYYLHATRTNLGPIRQDVNAVWDLAPHDIAIFNYLLEDSPLWASAIGTRVLKTSRDDIAFATLGYRNGVVGNIHVSWSDPNKVREVVAVGSRRRVVFNDLNDVERVRYYERGVAAGDGIAETYGEFKLLVRDGDIVSPKVEPSEPLKNQCLEFVDAISTEPCPARERRVRAWRRSRSRGHRGVDAGAGRGGRGVLGDRMRVLAATFAYNEGDKIRRTLARHPPARTYDLLVADDGSTDGALDGIDPGVLVLRHETNRGIGATMKERVPVRARPRVRRARHPRRQRQGRAAGDPAAARSDRARAPRTSCRDRGISAAADSVTCRISGVQHARASSAGVLARRGKAGDREHERISRVSHRRCCAIRASTGARTGSIATSSSRTCC